MPERLSKAAIDRLGARLAASAVPTDDDLAELGRAQAQWIPALEAALAVTAAVVPQDAPSFHITHRKKTASTLVDKLRRGTHLSSMQDVVGIRVVGYMSLGQQDAVVRRLELGLGNVRIVDRRAKPTFGYRAMHVIARIGGYSVEIQVRTMFQHAWANATESIADRWGRGIRYGEPPAGADVEQIAYRVRELGLLQTVSERIAAVEMSMAGARGPDATPDAFNAAMDAVGPELRTALADGFRDAAFALLASDSR